MFVSSYKFMFRCFGKFCNARSIWTRNINTAVLHNRITHACITVSFAIVNATQSRNHPIFMNPNSHARFQSWNLINDVIRRRRTCAQIDSAHDSRGTSLADDARQRVKCSHLFAPSKACHSSANHVCTWRDVLIVSKVEQVGLAYASLKF